MIPWQHLDTVTVPGSSSELRLYRRDQEFSIRADGIELMNSRAYSSEDGFSELGCARIAGRRKPTVLIGGLGMGYSLRSALNKLPSDADVVVAELVPRVAQWNREQFGHLAGHPLRDARVTLREMDVGQLLRRSRGAFDLIMLDVDNGPEGLTRRSNDRLYSRTGLLEAQAALRPKGVLGYWSSGPDRSFVRRLQQVGFEVEECALRAVDGHAGVRHTVWFAVVQSAQREAVRRAEPGRR
jgi:spermidine synthase